ncbi:carboxypeptidase-like regulatory domain-containing protein [Stigmatella erecta]|uniref:Uncharacterized protein n=1 Tax=Stigmatella erecta TaxID=83460 RepID=A0A1I0L1R2_9BACT|nr:carboxypeptidase-like regulatory domain-containing protein [Stigmatella erecta]SEU32209.1 hypothetical protein SAMN05443639_116163 [Stigmatella erecta]
MDHEWVVTVVDSAGAAVSGAQVALVPSSALTALEWPFASIAATHTHQADGRYEALAPLTPTEGKWTLLVRAPGKSPVVQPLLLKAKTKTEFVTSPSPRTAATLAFASEIKTSGTTEGIRCTRFNVTLYPSAEFVFITGTEYEGKGTSFRIFAQNYRDGLRKEKTLDAGTAVTLFSTDSRSRETCVPAVGGEWLEVGVFRFGDATGIKAGSKHSPVPGSDVSVVHLYQYLSDIGAADPGRVKEVGIFSHSWPGGPILFNTADTSTGPARDPDDFDAREKDFDPVNRVNWPHLKDAMSPTGSWHVWGCSATTHYMNLVREAYKHKAAGEDQHFLVNTTYMNHRVPPEKTRTIAERTTRQRVRAFMDTRFRSNTYMAAAASYLGLDVFGAPPGVGSNFGVTMYIDTKTYASVYAYFTQEFKPEFAPTHSTYDKGYVNYRLLATRAAPVAAPFSSEYYRFEQEFTPGGGKSTLLFANNRRVTLAGATGISFKVTPKKGFATAGKAGHLYELHDASDSKKSRAVYVQEDARTFLVDKDSLGKFTVLGKEVP